MPKQKLTWRHILRRILSLVFSRLVVTSLTTVLLLVWSVVSLAGVSTFLYFNF